MRIGNEARRRAATRDAVGMAAAPYLAEHHPHEPVPLADGASTRGRLAVVALDLEAGSATPWHRADGTDLSYLVLSGRLELTLLDRAWTVSPLALVHCPRGTLHRRRALTAAQVVVLATPAGVEPFLVHGAQLAATDPALFLALAQEHRVEVLPDLLP